jgi:hypothetical protein
VDLNETPDLKTVMEGKGPTKLAYDRGKQTGHVAAWLDWVRKQLNEANLDFIENWSGGFKNQPWEVAEFFVMNASRDRLAARITIIVDTVHAKMRIKLHAWRGEKMDEILDKCNLPLDPEQWDSNTAQIITVFVSALADLELKERRYDE